MIIKMIKTMLKIANCTKNYTTFWRDYMLIFEKAGNDYLFSAENNNKTSDKIAILLPPSFEGDSADFDYKDNVQNLGDGLFEVARTVKSTSSNTQKVKLITTLRDCFVRTHWLVPCVNFNGNEFGGDASEAKFPMGFTYEGQPWIYAYDRTGIPSCSLSENKNHVVALFASDCDATSLTSSVSVTENEDGTINHMIYYPITEAPYSYTNTNTLTERVDGYLSFEANEEKTFKFHIYLGTPLYENYGAASLMNRITDELFDLTMTPTITPEKQWEVGIKYAESLIKEYDGRRMFASGRWAELYGKAFSGPGKAMEIGWAGQGALNAYLFILNYKKTGEKHFLDDALSYLDAWCEKQHESGLFLAHFEWYPKPGEPEWTPAQTDSKIIASFHIPGSTENNGVGWYPEACNLGWGALQMARAYSLLKELGIDKPEYLTFAKRTCDFFKNHYSAEFGFGKSWRFDGTSYDTTGSIGGFIIPALLEVWRITDNKEYLNLAKRSLEFYIKRDVDSFACTAGAIDCACVDKETVYPLMLSALDLYDLTKEEKYKEWAIKCGYYFFSWAYHYDALYPSDSDFERYGYHTKGGTAVSAQHHAIDSWGSLLVPEFIRLYELTDDRRWYIRARALWCNATMCIAQDENYVINKTPRPIGSQNEAFFQCRWTRYRKTPDERGHFNNWLIAWVNAYRLFAVHKLGMSANVFQI